MSKIELLLIVDLPCLTMLLDEWVSDPATIKRRSATEWSVYYPLVDRLLAAIIETDFPTCRIAWEAD